MIQTADRFNSPAFLTCVVKHGLLKGTATLEDAYELYGRLTRSQLLRGTEGLVAAVEALAPADLLKLRESLTGVIPFPGGRK